MLIEPYLSFNGNCEEAFNFYKTVFGGEFSYFGRFRELPVSEKRELSEEEGEKIMHIALPVGEKVFLMGSDRLQDGDSDAVFGNNVSVSISPDTKENTIRFFNQLSEGGDIIMTLTKTFWAELYGIVIDRFGITWILNYKER